MKMEKLEDEKQNFDLKQNSNQEQIIGKEHTSASPNSSNKDIINSNDIKKDTIEDEKPKWFDPQMQSKERYKYKYHSYFSNNFRKYCYKFKNYINEDDKSITSFGVIVFHTDVEGKIKYLLMKRKDSISYIEFLKNNIKEEDMEKYVSLMSLAEKQKCVDAYLKKSPRLVWDDLWVNHFCKCYKDDYEKCSLSFMDNMKKYYHLFTNPNIGMKENEWGFPKGRKFRRESELECALREFREETNLSTYNIRVIKNKVYEETYIGSDNKSYRTIYFIAYCPLLLEFKLKKLDSKFRNAFISEETDELSWSSLEDSQLKLNEKRSELLKNVEKYILEYRRNKRRYLTK